MRNDKKIDWILAGLIFLVSAVVYYTTMAPTLSFWDCGELISSAKTLGNPHPPGNPLLILMWRVFIMVIPFTEVAARTNLFSVVTSALVASFAFLIVIKALRMVFPEGGINRFAVYAGGLIGAFLVAFSDTEWFSAVETETNGPSMLFVMIITWLSLRWYEQRGTWRADRLLLMIGYLAFLGFGVHLFALVTLPMVGLFLLLDKETRSNIPLLVAGLAVFSIIYDVGDFPFIVTGAFVLFLVILPFAKSSVWRRRWWLATMLCFLALAGVSSYAYVPIRSSVNVSLDEAEATSWPVLREYIERKQYGSDPMILRALHRRGQLANQVLVHPHMGYGGYMLAQYFPWKVGDRDEDTKETLERHVAGKTLEFPTLHDALGNKRGAQFSLFLLMQIPFLYGGWLIFRRNRKLGLYLLGLYVVTSYGLIFYLNFADGTQMELRDYQYWKEGGFQASQKPPPVYLEVRERDYFFTPGFLYMGILFGISAAFLLDWLAKRRRALLRPAGVILVGLAVVAPVWSNYKEHNRSGDYVPYDYAYNLLNSCKPNAILFTNGDNDTFPLWFLQQVEGIRKDVRVVNLSLVNTNWYMHQLTDHAPALKIGFSPAEIDALQPQPWRFKGPVDVSIPGTRIRYTLEPLPYLRVQDIMVLHIVQNNFPAHPVQFATTVGGGNSMGLEPFTIMEGMVYTLVQDRAERALDVASTVRMVDSVYRFRGLGDPNVYLDENTTGLLTNYSVTNFRLAGWAQDTIRTLMPKIAAATGPARAALESRRDSLVTFAEKYLKLNARILPGEWRVYYYAAQLYSEAGETERSDSALRAGLEAVGTNTKVFAGALAQSYVRQGRTAEAAAVLQAVVAKNPADLEMALTLSEVHQQAGDLPAAIEALSAWLKRNPSHEYAQAVGQRIQQMQAAASGAPGAPAPMPAPAPAGK
ncbi:MAG TPA: DUF2723 domain-containing protein [Fibrobacteria bacterium]|nr:DUF2723 domain-containing protein [Fibrobacteria bacterium]